ncbi:MAG: hypothetical protein J6K92_11040 [Oscillospiraceae bacterium]|nr:hypothetical protein [Oscillospiraceae bacterium]
MSLKRFQPLYPYFIFRAQIVFKNVAPPDDHWAVGVLCRDFQGNFSIINKKAGDGAYEMCAISIDTLGLASGFKDGNRSDVFEGDIVRIRRFSQNNGPELFGKDDNERRIIYADVPEGCEMLSSLDGVVFMSGGIFYVQFFDEETGALNALPLYMFFGFDMLPVDGAAVRVIGNIYEDEELYAKTLHLSETGQCCSYLHNQA